MRIILAVSVVIMTLGVVNVKYREDITHFFPKSQRHTALIFNNIKAKDRIVVMFTAKEGDNGVSRMMDCADLFTENLKAHKDFGEMAGLSLRVDGDKAEALTDFIYDNLPIFMDDTDYAHMDSVTRPGAIREKMERNYGNMTSLIGGFVSEYIVRDPLGLGSESLKDLRNQGNNVRYVIEDDYIFSEDMATLMGFVDPRPGNSSGDNEILIRIIEEAISETETSMPDVEILYFGAPAVAAYNARQIKIDSMITLNIAIIAVVLFIALSFRNKRNIWLALTPVAYGVLFALALIYLIKGEISLIAVGAGSAIFGVALSYSIHVLSHTNHCHDVRRLISELAYPLTIGSFTTIGAFAGLLFTNSALLQDFGLFASLALVGTTLYSLIFLPHFLKLGSDSGDNKLLKLVDRAANLRFDRSRVLAALIVILTIVCAIFFNNVSFDSDMMKLNFEPPHLREAEKKLNSITSKESGISNVMFISAAENNDDAAREYTRMCMRLDSLKSAGEIPSYASISRFVVPAHIQAERLRKWADFWSEDKRREVISSINREAARLGFEEGTFARFTDLINRTFPPIDYSAGSEMATLFPDWLSGGEDLTTFTAQVMIADSVKQDVYSVFAGDENIIAADRSFFASKMAEDVNDNFYLILYFSSLLIFFALFISYGRIELTLMSFLPMFVSWIMILGIMALLGIEFNIVTIILSTFIFGIGDDFSIFIMDGLQGFYKDKTPVLSLHKTAIFFSAFVIMVGMGTLIFAKHPALYSLGLISLIGILVVVLVAYTIQPLIFRLFVTSQTEHGGFPYTLMGLLNTIYAFGLFVSGCFVIQGYILSLHLIPVKSSRRKEWVHRATSWSTYAFLKAMVTTKMVRINEGGETFSKPAVVIANHQSFIDILVMMGLHRKFVMVTNSWVWESPFFGKIVRYLDFFHTGDGYENLAKALEAKVAEGYSIVVFPEGTRSADLSIKRFHKGAFYLAEQLKLDIIPVLLYGNGLVSSKRQPFYIKKGLLVSKILPRIAYDSTEYGRSYKERTKGIARYFNTEYDKLYEEYNRIRNPYFKDALIKNYIYKGPVLEWYMRIKLRMERGYDNFDRLLPREGHIVDLGCGYGPLTYMLSLLSRRRRMLGVDYDQSKIALANNCFSKNGNMTFVHANIATFEIPKADAFILNDVLHYMDYEKQGDVLSRCFKALNPGGMVVIRDGDSSLSKQHARTERTEKWSTRILGFNKTEGELHFTSEERIRETASHGGMEVRIAERDPNTSNTIYILTRKNE